MKKEKKKSRLPENPLKEKFSAGISNSTTLATDCTDEHRFFILSVIVVRIIDFFHHNKLWCYS